MCKQDGMLITQGILLIRLHGLIHSSIFLLIIEYQENNKALFKGWSQNGVKNFFLYNVKIEGDGGLRIFTRKDSNL